MTARFLGGKGREENASETAGRGGRLGAGTRPWGRAASGRQDLNLRPPDPEPGALPD